MNKLIKYISLILILVLIALSVFGAFLGSQRAQSFFGSLPLVLYWSLLALVSFASIILFSKNRQNSLFLIHLGIILIILGSFLASPKCHKIQSKLFGITKPQKAQMLIHQGSCSCELYDESQEKNYNLPFSIRLNDFIVEYYQPYILIAWFEGGTIKLPVELGNEFLLSNPFAKIKIIRTFENLEIIPDSNDTAISVDLDESGNNPAVELEITKQDGTSSREYVFQLCKGQQRADDQCQITYHRPVKDYISKVDIIKGDTVIQSANIEVNHPLHYGGYHFYQYSFDSEQEQYTILQVVSDNGLYLVYFGYAAFCAGIFWHFWLVKLRMALITDFAKTKTTFL